MINVDSKTIFSDDSTLDIDAYKNDDYTSATGLENDIKWEIDKLAADFFSEENLSEETVYKLRDDYHFRIDLLHNVQERIENIIINNSTLLFKELVCVINLLSLGKKYKIFEKYNEYSSNEISKLFRDYEAVLANLSNTNRDEFDLMFGYYVTLLDAFNELCIINATDVIRKKSIGKIIELITESINMLKFSVTLNGNEIAILNSFQGELILRFSNVLYISAKDKTAPDLIDEYKFIFNKQVDGYSLSINAFTPIEESGKQYLYLTFLANSTELLLLLLMKLEKYENKSFEQLNDILEVYSEECLFCDTQITSIEEFKNSLLNNLVYICDQTLKISYKELIKFIIDNQLFSSTNMQIIQNLILFSDDINEDDLIFVFYHVLKQPKMANDYHEYHKLKIIDIIINKLIKNNSLERFIKFVPIVVKYMNNANTATHLLSAFSKIYLSLSYFYSLLGEEHIDVSQEKYFIGEKICSYPLAQDEYQHIFEKILVNNAQSYLNRLSLPNRFNHEELITFGHSMMKEFFANQEIRIKYDVNREIEKMIEDILKTDNYNEENLKNHIGKILSQKIFFGLATCKIADDSYSVDTFKEIGYEILESRLIHEYKIYYKYSYSYKQNFNMIFKENKTYIKNNISNILMTLKKCH